MFLDKAYRAKRAAAKQAKQADIQKRVDTYLDDIRAVQEGIWGVRPWSDTLAAKAQVSVQRLTPLSSRELHRTLRQGKRIARDFQKRYEVTGALGHLC